MPKRIHIIVEVDNVPDSRLNLLRTFHGIFDDYAAAQAALRTVADALLINPKIGEYSARGHLAENPSGPETIIYIQSFSQFNKVVI